MKKSIIFNGHFVQVFPPRGIIRAGGHKTTDLLMIFFFFSTSHYLSIHFIHLLILFRIGEGVKPFPAMHCEGGRSQKKKKKNAHILL